MHKSHDSRVLRGGALLNHRLHLSACCIEFIIWMQNHQQILMITARFCADCIPLLPA